MLRWVSPFKCSVKSVAELLLSDNALAHDKYKLAYSLKLDGIKRKTFRNYPLAFPFYLEKFGPC